MARPDASSRLFMLAAAAFVVAALYFARNILLPFALAVLLTFLLSPLVTRLQRAGLPRIPSVIAVVLMAFLAIGVVAWLLTDQIIDVTARLPEYRHTLREKVDSVRGPGRGVLSRVTETFGQLRDDLEPDRPEYAVAPAPTGPPGEEEPVPVQVVAQRTSPLAFLRDWLGPLLAPLGQAGIVIVFVIFMLIKREDLRNRFLRLVGEQQLHVATQALDDAGRKVSRYLRMQLLVNAIYGTAVGVGVATVGLPNALFFGLLATILRFVPYVGPWVAALMPITLSVIVFEGGTGTVILVVYFVALELVVNNVFEPWLYGTSTGVSMVGIIASAVFWTWLWGAVGLVLATPLTVCLTVLGRHVPQLGFLNILLGEESALAPHARFYQRLLAMDQEEAGELVDEFLRSSSVDALYDEVVIPALHLAEQDRHRKGLDEIEQRFIRQAILDLMEDVAEAETAVELSEAPPAGVARLRVACIPARDDADELAAKMLAQRLVARGCAAEALSLQLLSGEIIEAVQQQQARVIVVSAIPPAATLHARYLVKRLRARMPDAAIIVGLWHAEGNLAKTSQRFEAVGADRVVTYFGEIFEKLPPAFAPHPSLPQAAPLRS